MIGDGGALVSWFHRGGDYITLRPSGGEQLSQGGESQCSESVLCHNLFLGSACSVIFGVVVYFKRKHIIYF